MDFWKKKRAPLRAAFTKKAKELDDELKKEEVDPTSVEIFIKTLENKYSKVEEADEEIMSILQEEDAEQDVVNAEVESTGAYNDQYILLRTLVKSYFEKIKKNEEDEFQSVSDGVSVRASESKRKFKLPKIEWKKFNGEPKEWLGFWGQFTKIDEDKEMDPADKFQYLLQAVESGSRAAELVGSFPPSGKCYPKAIESLKDRFGNEQILVEVYVRELLRLVLQNALNPKAKITLSSLYDKLETQLRALESLGVTSDKYAAMLYPLVESCLPEDVLRAWERSRNRQEEVAAEPESNSNKSQLTLLMAFLRGEVKGEERILMARQGFTIERDSKEKKTKQKVESKEEIPTAAGLLSGEGSKSKKKVRHCIFCDMTNHDSRFCNKAKKMDLQQKKDIIMKKGCCYICCGDHFARNCDSKVQCPVCQRKHLKILCPDVDTQNKGKSEEPKNEKPTSEKSDTILANQNRTPDVLLQTLLVRVIRGDQEKVLRAIIDGGSQRTYISTKVVQDLKFQSQGEHKMTHCLFGGSETAPKIHHKYEIRMCNLDRSYYCRFMALDQDVICGEIPRVSKGSWISELKEEGIELSDFGATSKNIELLIGGDIEGKLYTGNQRLLSNGLVARETFLGWTVSGKAPENVSQRSNILLTHSLLANEGNVSNLWKLDTLGILDPAEKQSQQELQQSAVDHFLETVKTDESGRFQISLPWIEGHPPLRDNKELVEKRLIAMTKKLTQENRKAYQSVFDLWVEQRIIEEVPTPEVNKFGYYLPHRPVFNEHSKTTPVRPVFDASAKVKNSVSLNDCLEKGPNLLELVPSLLSRFRLERTGVVADITKAFLQIDVDPQDQDFLRFLWWEKDGNKIVVYRHRRVVFGLCSSPFLLGATLNYILDRVPDNLQNTARKLKSSLYVDNCVTSLDSEESARQFSRESVEILSTGKFDLRGWIIRNGTEEYTEGGSKTSVLGLVWDLQDDTLACDLERVNCHDGVVTKRSVLSAAHKVYDPIGFTAPVLLYPKLLLQDIWKLKLGWDVELPKNLSKRFIFWKSKLPALHHLKIPRWFGGTAANSGNWCLHTFCDASISAFATAVYLRIEEEDSVTVHLVQAKSRVAPVTTSVKKITIPRLELLACLIGVRLTETVKEDFGLPDIPTYFWTDSMNALYWIRTEDSWGTFVWNRVREIRSRSRIEDWHHVPGAINPSDLPSRGCFADQLVESKWWEGPSWLRDKTLWPANDDIVPDEQIVNEERKKTVVTTLVVKRENTVKTEWISEISNSYSSMLQVMGYVLRFIRNTLKSLRKRKNIPETSLEAIGDAELVILYLVQKESLQGKALQRLEVFNDEKGLLRIKTKLLDREDSDYFREPIILPSSHQIVSMIVREKHQELCHAGVQTVMACIRERFWILKSRQAIRKILLECQVCKRYRKKTVATPPIQLPKERVTDAAVFQVIGVDLAGPLFLKNKQKAWIVLFTCAVYRAVHLELVTSLSTAAFLQAVRRFVARRGRPSVIYSDNGTNFVGAQNALKDLDWLKVKKTVNMQRIEWRFSPPSAPWWGGWWERLIGVVKSLLRKVLGRASFEYEELSTILCDCESVVNSRPLTYISDDPEDLSVLTPLVFLQDITDSVVLDVDMVDSEGLNRRARYLQKIREDLRKRFRTEYLGQLVHRGKKKETDAFRTGDLVLIADEKTKRLYWPLGRVIEIFRGRDGTIRVARVRTATGILTRPVQKLHSLEVNNDDRKMLLREQNVSSTAKEAGVLQRKTKDPEPEIVTRSGRKVTKPKRFGDLS